MSEQAKKRYYYRYDSGLRANCRYDTVRFRYFRKINTTQICQADNFSRACKNALGDTTEAVARQINTLCPPQ